MESVILGDFNLDYNKWESPDQDFLIMTELMKDEIETLGSPADC